MTQGAIRDAFGRTAQRRGDAAARRCGGVPVRIGLAGRHQRHARDDRVQLQIGRLPADDRRPRADADLGDPGRARREDPRVPRRAATGRCSALSRRGRRSTTAAGSTRTFKKSDDDPDRRAERLWDEDPGAGHRRHVRGEARHRHRGDQALDAGRAAALRPDQPPARGQRSIRPFGAHDAVARAGAVRKAQGADLSANGFARAARGLPGHRQGDDGSAARVERLRGLRRTDPEVQVGQARTSASSTTARSPITSRSFRRCNGRRA